MILLLHVASIHLESRLLKRSAKYKSPKKHYVLAWLFYTHSKPQATTASSNSQLNTTKYENSSI